MHGKRTRVPHMELHPIITGVLKDINVKAETLEHHTLSERLAASDLIGMPTLRWHPPVLQPADLPQGTSMPSKTRFDPPSFETSRGKEQLNRALSLASQYSVTKRDTEPTRPRSGSAAKRPKGMPAADGTESGSSNASSRPGTPDEPGSLEFCLLMFTSMLIHASVSVSMSMTMYACSKSMSTSTRGESQQEYVSSKYARKYCVSMFIAVPREQFRAAKV